MQQRGVPPALVDKMRRGGALTLGEVFDLSRRGVPDSYIVRAIQEGEVRYTLGRGEMKRLRAARVDRTIVDALKEASDVSAIQQEPGPHVYSSLSPYPETYDFGPYPGFYTYPYQPGFAFGGSRWRHGP